MAETNNSSMFGCFPAVIIAVLFGFLTFLGARQSASSMTAEIVPPASAQAVAPAVIPTVVDGKQSPTVIEKVETQVSGSTISLTIGGYQPDGCKFPVQVQQTRTADKVSVQIFRVMPKGVLCTMELNPYNDTITLDGTFEAGTYTINVNGTVVGSNRLEY